jgi:26S proteasome regulatory subunit T1
MKEKETKTLPTEDDTLSAKPLDEEDVALLKTYGRGPYSRAIDNLQNDIEKHQQIVKDLTGVIKDNEGLLPPSQWDLVSDKRLMTEEAALQVAHCQQIIETADNIDESDDITSPSKPKKRTKYVVKISPNDARFVVDLGEQVAPTDIEEGMRIGVSRSSLKIEIPLPSQVDASVSLMTVENKPDVTYEDLGGCREAKDLLREVVETPLLHPERFERLGIEPPKVRTQSMEKKV